MYDIILSNDDSSITAFMKELNEGYIPKELMKKYNKQIGIALEDKRDTKFRPPTPPKYIAYSGEGMSIG